MLFLSESNVRQCLSMKDCIEVNRKALASLASNNGGGGLVPPRIGLQHHSSSNTTTDVEDWSLFKPAAHYQQQDGYTSHMGMKLVSVRAENPSRGLPLVPATVLVVDPPTGIVEAVLSATYLTAARTAAGSALATQLCCRNAKHLVLFGAGLQAECHIEAIQCVLLQDHPLERITIINRSRDRAEQLAAAVAVAAQQQSIQTNVVLLQDKAAIQRVLQEADIVVACTNTMTPLFDGAWLKKGCHVNGIGSYTPNMQEIDKMTVERSTVLIDTPEARLVGDLKHLMKEQHHHATPLLLGDVLQNNSLLLSDSNNNNSRDCTFYKAVGTAIQDVMTGHLIVQRAKELGIGQYVDMS